jgi:hypothetical protein
MQHLSYPAGSTIEIMGNPSETNRALRKLLPAEFSHEERLFNEINLLRIEGFYFCFDPKEAARRAGKQVFTEYLKNPEANIQERPVVIVPNAVYGYPSVLAYKVLHAILKKLSDQGYPVPNAITFSQRELLRLVGRSSWGGMSQKQLYNAIKQLSNTEVTCWMFDKDTDQWMELSFRILTHTRFAGRRNEISQCQVDLDNWIVKSLNSRYAFCLNYARIEHLEPIGTALYKHLYYHCSNVYSMRKKKTFSYTKDYADICATWLGGLKVLRYKSKIMQEQLGTHLAAIQQTGLIKKYALEKNAAGDGFNLTVHPGPAFFEDYDVYYTKRLQYEMAFAKEVAPPRREEPMTLVAHFYSQLHPAHKELEHMVFLDKETDLAESLLEKYSYAELQDLIAYTIDESCKTRFAIRNFGGVKVYLPSWQAEKAARERQAQRHADAQTQAREAQLQADYQAFRQDAIERLKKTLPTATIARYETEAREELIAEGSHPITIDLMSRVRAESRLADEYGIPSFEDWKTAA